MTVSRSAPTLIVPKEELGDEERSAAQTLTDPEAQTENPEGMEPNTNDFSQKMGETVSEQKDEIVIDNANKNMSEQIPSFTESECNNEKKKELEVIT